MTVGFDPERYWSERLEQTYSLGGVGWLGLGEEFNRWMYAVRRQVFTRALRSRVATDWQVLDVGSGTGFYIQRWQEMGVGEIAGSDLTSVAVKRLRERFPTHTFHKLDITGDLPSDLGPFDAVSVMDVLYHVVDDGLYARAIQNLAGLVKPGGVLVLSENLVHRGAGRAEHEVDRGIDEITSLLHEAGLVIESRRPVFVLMNTPVDSDSVFLRKSWTAIDLLVRRGPRYGQAIGAVLFPVEVVLTQVVKEGPSTEIVVCRKPVGSR